MIKTRIESESTMNTIFSQNGFYDESFLNT